MTRTPDGQDDATGYRTITRTEDWPAGHQVALFHVDGDADAAAERLAPIPGWDPVVMAVAHPARDRPPARYLLLPAEQAARWRAAATDAPPGDLGAVLARLSTKH